MPDPLRQSVSATESPALFGVSPYITRWMLYRQFKFGEEIPNPEHNRMDWGKRMEPLVLAAAGEDLRLEIRPNRGPAGGQIYVRNGLLGCTRDAQIICPDRGPGALETKCVFDYRVWMQDWAGGKTPPRHHEIQLQQQMKVGDGTTSFKWGVLAAWVGGEIFYFERKPIPELWAALETQATEFFGDLLAGNEPPPFGAMMELPLMQTIFVPEEKKILELTEGPEARAWAEKVRMCDYHAQAHTGHEKAAKSIKAELAALLTDHCEAIFPHGIKVKNERRTRAGHTVKPSAYNQLSIYVPENLPEGDIGF